MIPIHYIMIYPLFVGNSIMMSILSCHSGGSAARSFLFLVAMPLWRRHSTGLLGVISHDGIAKESSGGDGTKKNGDLFMGFLADL